MLLLAAPSKHDASRAGGGAVLNSSQLVRIRALYSACSCPQSADQFHRADKSPRHAALLSTWAPCHKQTEVLASMEHLEGLAKELTCSIWCARRRCICQEASPRAHTQWAGSCHNTYDAWPSQPLRDGAACGPAALLPLLLPVSAPGGARGRQGRARTASCALAPPVLAAGAPQTCPLCPPFTTSSKVACPALHPAPCSSTRRECVSQSVRHRPQCPVCKAKVGRRDVSRDETMDRVVTAFAGLQAHRGELMFC